MADRKEGVDLLRLWIRTPVARCGLLFSIPISPRSNSKLDSLEHSQRHSNKLLVGILLLCDIGCLP